MKKTDVSEKGLEDIIVDHLVTVNGYELGKSDDFDAKFAVDRPKLHGFLLKRRGKETSADAIDLCLFVNEA